MFSALGIPPLLGRPFLPEDDRAGQPARVVLSYGFWQRHFGGDPKVLGQQLIANGTPYDVAGVMPRDFSFPNSDTQLWITFDDQRKTSTYRKGGYLQVIARLKPGVSIHQAQTHMEEVHRRIAEENPDDREFGIRLIIRGIDRTVPVRISQLDDVIRRSEALVTGRFVIMVLGSLAGAAGLLAILGIYGVLAYTVTQRTREIGIRMALGADKGSVVRVVLLRGLVMAGAGLCVGILGSIGVAGAEGDPRA